MEREELVTQFDELLRPSFGMRFLIAYAWALVAVLSVGSFVVLRRAHVTGDWQIAVPVPLVWILLFMLIHAIRGLTLRYQSARRSAVSIFWMCAFWSFVFSVGFIARSVSRFDVERLWQSVGWVLLSVLWVLFFSCCVFCSLYLENAAGAHRYFGGKMPPAKTRPRYVQRGAGYGRGPYHRHCSSGLYR